ncbi:RagB/SusD family nutrient uptake outer membrane protein [Portibacter marinus]|uniref:RagB/SusD family nutrient uptake outer membrane protein n=1 Tax=Portibacter marinus TaxID=2898660 RepID=UPI001F470210|nr:RagB/SusD family nutrient uptake outer membrane protein [Portibacter marinus]
MKNTICLIALLVFGACTDLDLVPLDAPTSAPFTSKQQFREGVNEGYRMFHWIRDESQNGMTDDFQRRDALDEIKAGTMNAESARVAARWQDKYKGISRMLAIKDQLENQVGILGEKEANVLLGETHFFLASFWSYLISHYGDVPFYEDVLSVDEAFEVSRTDKEVILQTIYDYYDHATEHLPVSYSGQQYVTKGAALAMKARIALYMGDYPKAAESAKACMDLAVYELHPSYSELFLSGTKTSNELIFFIPRSDALNVRIGDADLLPRIHGGWGAKQPTWELLASYECVDGLPIDKSPLFDPQNPFKNRDPRCLATIVPFGSLEEGDGKEASDGSIYMGIEYNPHPDALEVLNANTGEMIYNHDTRANKTFASFNGLLWKKGLDENWKAPTTAENNHIVIRYADVLLMYAEAKMELNEIDNSVLAAINQVRDRAYAQSSFTNPAVTTTNQEELRYIIRNERRAELAFEGLRYMDLIRWRLAHEVLSGHTYGMLDVADLKAKVVDEGLWFWALTPEIDENGFANFNPLIEAGYARTLNVIDFPQRQYLFPIPSEEILLAPGLAPNNEGY